MRGGHVEASYDLKVHVVVVASGSGNIVRDCNEVRPSCYQNLFEVTLFSSDVPFRVVFVKSRVLFSVWRRAVDSSLCGSMGHGEVWLLTTFSVRFHRSVEIQNWNTRTDMTSIEYGAKHALSCEDWSRRVDLCSMSRGIDSGAAASLSLLRLAWTLLPIIDVIQSLLER